MERSAVLLSGGVDSVVLMALERAADREVWPLHVRTGLAWEAAEATAITRILASDPFTTRVQPVTALHFDMRDVYPPSHWAVRGEARPYMDADETVYLEGRNITLVAKAAVFCASHGIGRLVLGPLAGNPFPDASAAFFEAMGRAMSIGLAHPLTVAAPLSDLHKDAVIRLGCRLGVQFEHTLSCNGPVEARHCGRCNKCRERRDAFTAADVVDPVEYVFEWRT